MSLLILARRITDWLLAPTVGRCQGFSLQGGQCHHVATRLLTLDSGNDLEVCPSCSKVWENDPAVTLTPLNDALPYGYPDQP